MPRRPGRPPARRHLQALNHLASDPTGTTPEFHAYDWNTQTYTLHNAATGAEIHLTPTQLPTWLHSAAHAHTALLHALPPDTPEPTLNHIRALADLYTEAAALAHPEHHP